MKFSEYISHNQVFTTENLLSEADSRASAKQQLKLAAASGAVKKVRRGLYVSNYGRFEDVQVDPFVIVAALDPNAVISYHSALEAHGVAHNVGFECHFRTDVAKTAFTYEGVTFVPHAKGNFVHVQRARNKSFQCIKVTTREQTIIDCFKYPEFSGGIEEVVRSLSAFPYINIATLMELLKHESASVCARVGLLLQLKQQSWRVQDDCLQALHAASSNVVSRLDKKQEQTRGWCAAWNITLPESLEEVGSWTS
jgi:predicted transcriptional regulator of viral defense system